MLASLLAAAAFQVGPFYEQKPDYCSVRPLAAVEEDTADVLWPVFTWHRDWWRFCFLAYWQDFPEDGSYQFTLLPIWFNGRDGGGDAYAGLFPIYGRHPHFAMMYDARFALWPLWHQYKTPRGREWLTSNSVLFPFFSWRSDGAWSVWPLYGVNYQRESDHRYFLWPVATWALYREDRDTAGRGYSWMLWPLYGQVRRGRESQDLFLPPFFSFARTASPARVRWGESSPDFKLRCPWPFFEYETTAARNRLSVWPLFEHVENRKRFDGSLDSSVTRFGWRLFELYRDEKGKVEESRFFPFWASGRGHFRLWPLWESATDGDVVRSRTLALFPIRWVPAVDRNWSKFWTFYETMECPLYTDHSLLWGLIRWRTSK